MKILHLSQTDINADSRILKELESINKFKEKLDTDIEIYGLGVHRDIGNKDSSSIENIKIFSVNLFSKNIKYFPKSLINIMMVCEIFIKMFFKAYRLKPDIIHCHDTPVLPLAIALKIFLKVKVIYDAHELESNRNELPKISGILVLCVEKVLWKFIDALIVVSPSIRSWYTLNIGEKLSEVILNSPLLQKGASKSANNYLRQYFSIGMDKKIFIYIGGFQKGRGIESLIEVFQKDSITSHLVLLGYGPLREELINISQYTQNIHVHDAVAHEEVVPIAQSADVGLCFIQNVSLSDYYCLPNKLFEYAFAEIPILASNFPDMSMIVKKYNLGKCSDIDIDSIYIAIKEFELQEELPKIDAQTLYDLSWDAQETKLINLYKTLIKKIKEESK